MAAGLGFKTFNTGDVLSAADVNGYLMQGVLVFADATARDAAITSPQEGQFAYTKDNNSLWYYSGSAWVSSGATGDIEGVTAGTGISGGGTSGTVTITNSMATAIDAKGDLVAGTGADAFARLAVGTNGQVLTADSAETTGLKWAAAAGGGAFTLINTGGSSLTGASVTVSSIPTTYTDLYVIVRDYSTNTDNDGLLVRINSDTGTNYAQRDDFTTGAALSWNSARWNVSEGNDNSTADGLTVVYFYDYANTATYKMANYYTVSTDGTNTSNYRYRAGAGLYKVTNTAITSLTFLPEALGTFSSGTVFVYGVK